jgi:hypothetical protein
MSKAKLTTPILVEIENNLYKVIYIKFADDGSIYVFFPRKRGYFVAKNKDLPEKVIGKQTFSLDEFPENIFSPYITYHPKSKAIHINTKNARYKYDAEVVNLAEDKNILAFPLCQILFPCFVYLDMYTYKKDAFPYVIKSKTFNPPSSLNIEIFIHPVGTYFEWEDLPLDKARRATSNPVGLARFNSAKLKSYTCTIAITELKTKANIVEGVIPGIIVAMFNEKQPYIFELHPSA